MTTNLRRVFLLLAAATLLLACDSGGDTPSAARDTATASAVAARVRLQPTASHEAAGGLVLTNEAGGVRIRGAITGLAPRSAHGFHVHENGDCSAADGSSAGGHFNPTDEPHGGPNGAARHAGDMANVTADDRGIAALDMVVAGLTVGGGGAKDVLGRAVIVHAEPDDYESQPSGAAGARIACGVIEPSGDPTDPS